MDLKTYLRQQELSKTTVETYHYHTLDFIAFLERDTTEVENCTEKEILLYLNHLQKQGVGNQTKKLRLYALKHFFDYQIANNQRNDNPAKRIKIRGTQQQKMYPILSPQELQALYQNYEAPKEDDKRSHHNWFTAYRLSKERNKVVLGLLVNQGITTAEVKRILLEDLNLRNGTIDIRGGRIGKDRTLELKSSQVMDLMEYQYKTRNELLKYHKEPSKQLFLSTPASGRAVAKKAHSLDIWKRLTQDIRAHNPKFINFKQVRSSVIVHWLKNYNLRQVQYFAGHRHILSTEMYLINDIDDLQKDIDSFHPMG